MRDFADVARLLTVFPVDHLIALVRERDPGFEDTDYAAVGLHLDKLPDEQLVPFLRDGWTLAMLRNQFADWPRAAGPRQRG